MVAELLALVYIRDMHLDDGTAQRTDAVVQRHTGVGVGTGIEHDTVIAAIEARLLHLIDKLTLNIALEIVYLDVGKSRTQLLQVAVKRLTAVDARLTLAKQVQVRAVDNLYFHLFISFGCFQATKIDKKAESAKLSAFFFHLNLGYEF